MPTKKKKSKSSVTSGSIDSPRRSSGDDLLKAFHEFKKPGSEGAIQILSDLAVTCTEDDVAAIREKSSVEGELDYGLFKEVLDDFIEKAYEKEEESKSRLRPTKSMSAKGAIDPAALQRLNQPIPKGKETVRVAVRVRPFMPYEYRKAKELGQTMSPVVFMTQKECQLLNTETGEANHSFKFDQCFWSIPEEQYENPLPAAGQDEVFRYAGVPAVNHAFTGFNTCIFAYGQTGSGKTHSMLGNSADPGIAPRLINLLFDTISEYKSKGEKTKFEVRVCFLEIYNEKVLDLLMNAPQPTGDDDDEDPGSEGSPRPLRRRKSSASGMKKPSRKSLAPETEGTKYRECKVRFSPDKGTYVDGITRLNVTNANDTMASMQAGMKYRAVASHSLNATSSRSHAIFQICLKQTFILGTTRVSTVNIVDLAGSERVKMTHASGSVLDEAKNINQSLSTLRRVIDTLIENAKLRTKKIPPYRESMLTWVLKDSLGGNSKTVMIAAISPHFSNYEDTLNTLRYALKAKSIVLHAHVNEEQTAHMVSALKKELEMLKQQMASGGGGYAGDPVELQQAIEDLKKTELDAEEFKKKAETEMRVKDEQVKEEKKQRFAAVFRNAFFIEKKRIAAEDQMAAKDAEIAELQAKLRKMQEEMLEVKNKAAEKTAQEAMKAVRAQDEKEHLEEELNLANRREQDLRTEVEQARLQTRRETVRANSFETERDSLKEQVQQLSQLSRDEVDKLKKENLRLKSVDEEVVKLKVELADLQNQYDLLTRRCRQLEQDLAKAKKQIDKLLDEKAEMRRHMEELQDTNTRHHEDYQNSKRGFERELHILEVEMDQKDQQIKSLQKDVRQTRGDLEKALDEKRTTDDAMASIRLTHTKHQRNLVFRANELEEKHQKITELEKDNHRLHQELDNVQSQLITKESALSMQEGGSPQGPSGYYGSATSVTGSPLGMMGVNDGDLKGYVSGKFFPKGDCRQGDVGRPSPMDSAVPGERVWKSNGYVYGPSPHRSPSRSVRSSSPSGALSPGRSQATLSPRMRMGR